MSKGANGNGGAWRKMNDRLADGELRWRGRKGVKNEKARMKERGGCLGSILNHYSEDSLPERWNHAGDREDLLAHERGTRAGHACSSLS